MEPADKKSDEKLELRKKGANFGTKIEKPVVYPI
jgi:hypothetical protein